MPVIKTQSKIIGCLGRKASEGSSSKNRAGGMAQQFQALAALPEGPDQLPSPTLGSS